MKNTQFRYIILPSSDYKSAESYWQKIEKKVSNPNLTSTWDWVNTWLTFYRKTVDFWFVVGFKKDTPIGITLVTKELERKFLIPINSHHLGTQGEPYKDWVQMINNNVLALDEYYNDFVKILVRAINSDFQGDEFLIEDCDSQLAISLKKALGKHSDNTTEIKKSCHVTKLSTLRENKQTIMQQLSHDTRYSIRRNLKEFGDDLQLEWAEDQKTAMDIFEELVALHQKAFQKKGKRGAFSSKKLYNFHKALIIKLISQNRIILFRARSVRLGTIGCFYLFIDKNIAFGYQSGLSDFTNISITTINPKRIKPGFIMHYLCMEECMKRGIGEYNFSIGSDGYKKELSGGTVDLLTIKKQYNPKPKIRDFVINSYIKLDSNKKLKPIISPLYAVYKMGTKENTLA